MLADIAIKVIEYLDWWHDTLLYVREIKKQVNYHI